MKHDHCTTFVVPEVVSARRRAIAPHRSLRGGGRRRGLRKGLDRLGDLAYAVARRDSRVEHFRARLTEGPALFAQERLQCDVAGLNGRRQAAISVRLCCRHAKHNSVVGHRVV